MKNFNDKGTEFIVILAFASLMLFTFMPAVSALYIIEDVDDPYNPDCPFEAAPGESILYLHDYDESNYGVLFEITDPNMTIGQYIQDQYTEVWDLLSPDDQELYSHLWAVYRDDLSTPVLPNNVKRLLAGISTTANIRNYNGINSSALSLHPTSQLPSSASRFATTQHTQVLSSYSGDTTGTVATGYFSRGESSSKWNFNAALVTRK